MMEFISRRQGRSGTSPSNIVSAILEKKIPSKAYHLILITDGEIGVEEVDRCDNNIQHYNIRFAYATIYLVGRNIPANYSVQAAFSRHCGSRVIILRDDREYQEVAPVVEVKPEDLELLDGVSKIKSYKEFMNQYEGLTKALTARVLGSKGDRKLHDQFVQLQSRLLKRSLAKLPHGKLFEQAVDSNDFDLIVKAGSELVENYVQPPEDFEKNIQTLIRLSDGALRYTFTPDEIASTRATRAKKGKQVNVTSAVDVSTSTDNASFQCPISIEDETDPCVIIVKPPKPLLEGREKKFTDMVIDCPLNGLVDEQFVLEVIKCIDHPISLKSVREGENLKHPIVESPLTRRPVLGFLALGADESHVVASDWTLQQLFGKGLVLGARDFWFGVIWHIIYTGRVKYLMGIKDFVTEHMVFRLKKHIHTASLSGLSGFNQTPLRMDCAILFTLMSQFFDPKPPAQFDPLRSHLLCAFPLMDMVLAAGLKIPDVVKIFVMRTKTLIVLLNVAKKIGREALLSVGTALIQNSYEVRLEKIKKRFWKHVEFPLFNIPFVPLDGPATEASRNEALNKLPKSMRDIPINELYGLIQLADPKKPTIEIQIGLDWKAPDIPEVAHNWVHYDGKIDLLRNVKICPLTMRPYSEVEVEVEIEGGIEKKKVAWNEYMKNILGDGIILPAHKYYMEFCGKYDVFPSRDEFILYCLHRVNQSVNLGNAKTLMVGIGEYATSVMNDFNGVVKYETPKRLAEIFEKSSKLEDRKKLEVLDSTSSSSKK
jgi:hypothetical protein